MNPYFFMLHITRINMLRDSRKLRHKPDDNIYIIYLDAYILYSIWNGMKQFHWLAIISVVIFSLAHYLPDILR